MLNALYRYAVDHGLTVPQGYVKKTVKAYILLTSDGRFVGIDMGDDVPVPCPDVGSMANSKDKSNVLVEKRSVVIPAQESAKSRFFLAALEDGGRMEPMLALCAAVLRDVDGAAAIRAELDRMKVKDADRISFRVGGKSILDSPQTDAWWQEYRKQFLKGDGGAQEVCLITGEPTVPVATVPPISGLAVVGGHARGDALICFDKAAFCSYGLKQAANAPVSEAAISAVKAALDALLKDAPILDGMKFVHWYDKPVNRVEDTLSGIFDGFGFELPEDADDEPVTVNEAAENAKADALVRSVYTGGRQAALASEYYILLLTGVNGRVMIRRYEHGRYEELQRQLNAWLDDISLLALGGRSMVRPHKLTGMMIRLMKRQKSDRNILERLSKEMAGFTPAVLEAILSGRELPDSVAARALAYIRSQMLDSENTTHAPDAMACQWLKAWVRRREKKQQGEAVTMPYCNKNHPRPEYHCGRLVAVYTRIQQEAMPGVNAGIAERYYASASQTPALVLGTLGRMVNHHLAKISNAGTVRWFENMLSEINVAIGDTIPATLTLEQQAYFALGYRQQWAEMTLKHKSDAASNTDDSERAEETEE